MKNSNENLMIIDLFTAPKRYILQPKSKNFLCKGGSATLATPRRRNLLRRFRGMCVNSATFWKSATFAFILTCHKKPGRNPVLYSLFLKCFILGREYHHAPVCSTQTLDGVPTPPRYYNCTPGSSYLNSFHFDPDSGFVL